MNTPTLIIYSSRLKYVLLLIVSVGCIVGGAFLVVHMHGTGVWLGWFSIVFFGGSTSIFLWQLTDTKPRVVIDEEGVFDRTLGVGLIPWADIQSAYVKSTLTANFICLVLRNPELWIGKLSSAKKVLARANEEWGFQPLNINLSGTAADPAVVQDAVLKRCDEYSGNG